MAQLVPSLTVAFVIDTSVGMLQRNADGLSLLDQAKALVRAGCERAHTHTHSLTAP